MQEVIYSIKPDFIIESGMVHGRVVGVDIEIRAYNRKVIKGNELVDLLDLIEGSSNEK